MIEQWKPIVGFIGYDISSEGRVRSYRPKNGRGPLRTEPHLLKTKLDRYGYPMLTLRRGSKDVSKTIHRLVLETFIGFAPEGMQACHFDGNRENNHLNNLRWDTLSANAIDRTRHGTAANNFPRVFGESHGASKLTEEIVKTIRQKFADGQKKAQIAKEFNISAMHAANIVNRKVWVHI